MKDVIFWAVIVGGATILGGGVGCFFRCESRRFFDGVLSFAAGVMLAASMLGLIIPSLEGGGDFAVYRCIFGLFLGAGCVNLLDLIPSFGDRGEICFSDRSHRVFLFVCAIALHNLPEGIASGVGFGADDVRGGIMIATAIALQNIPEGLIVTASMMGVGVKAWRAFLISALTGVIEIIGCFIGYFAVSISAALLPFILAFAGGTMLYVISEEMIPETHSGDGGKLSTWFLLFGFSFMLLLNALI